MHRLNFVYFQTRPLPKPTPIELVVTAERWMTALQLYAVSTPEIKQERKRKKRKGNKLILLVVISFVFGR